LATRVEQPHVPAWQRGKVASWLVTVDHKRIGILYIGTAGLFFAISGFLALLIRTQLTNPDNTLITGNSYNEVVTMHGTGMVFFVMVPVLAGLANFIVPLQIGAQDMAFPRLNALSYWLYAFAGLVFCASFLASGGAANTGWTAYPPLSLEAVGNGQDLWILSIHILTLSSAAARSTSSSRSTTCGPAACRGCASPCSCGRSRCTPGCCSSSCPCSPPA